MTRYGEPQEVTGRAVTWYDNGPWKRTVLYKDGDTHRFPLPHQDVLWQTINYKVPLNKVAPLLSYDGSLLIDRTRGELTVHCDSEEANTLIFNIANDIVTGENTVEQAARLPRPGRGGHAHQGAPRSSRRSCASRRPRPTQRRPIRAKKPNCCGT